MPTPGDGVGSKEVNVHVIICFHHKLCLFTEGGDPQLSKHILVGQVVIGVMKPTLEEKIVHVLRTQ